MECKELRHASTPGILRKRLLAQESLQEYAEELVGLGRHGLRLVTTEGRGGRINGKRARSIGKLGGHPHLPSGFTWPRWGGVPLAFVAQLNLAKVPRRVRPKGLPKDGRLVFFALISPWNDNGSRFEQPCQWHVAHIPVGARIERVRFPWDLGIEARLYRQPVRGIADWTPARWDSPEVRALGLSSKQEDAYRKALGPIDEYETIHRFFGNADEIKGGLAAGAEQAATGARTKKDAGPTGWRVLLQVDSDHEGHGVVFGSAGRIFWMIREEDLALGKLENAVLVGQCY